MHTHIKTHTHQPLRDTAHLTTYLFKTVQSYSRPNTWTQDTGICAKSWWFLLQSSAVIFDNGIVHYCSFMFFHTL